MPPSRAIYLDEAGELSIREINETYTPTGAQSLVSVKYSAINPADLRHYYMGMHSYVAGYEYIGSVLATGPDSPFKKGDVLFGIAQLGHKKPLHAGAHQDFTLLEPFLTYKVPASFASKEERWPQAVGWPIGVHTAADALFNIMGFGLPGIAEGDGKAEWVVSGADPRGKAILIWGASSVVGLAAVQIARTAGFSPIFVTASSHNHAALLELGATACFDYRSPTVVTDIRAAVSASGKPLGTIFDAVAVGTGFAEPPSPTPLDLSKSSPAIAKQCLSDSVSKEDIRLSATLVVEFDPDWVFCLAIRTKEETPEYHDRLDTVVRWVWDHVDEIEYRLPKVRLIGGAEEGVPMMKEVFDGKVSMEKMVIKHPM